MYWFFQQNYLILDEKIKRIKLGIQKNMKRIIIFEKLNFASNFPSKLRKTCLCEINRACPKETPYCNLHKKEQFFFNGSFALPSYNLYFLPLMTGQTDLTIVAVVYILGLLWVQYLFFFVRLPLLHIFVVLCRRRATFKISKEINYRNDSEVGLTGHER